MATEAKVVLTLSYNRELVLLGTAQSTVAVTSNMAVWGCHNSSHLSGDHTDLWLGSAAPCPHSMG